jgi:hypothetical protein
MGNLKDNLKSLGSSAAKALVSGAKTVVSAAQEQIQESNRKRQIVNKMYPGTIKELARQRGLRPDSFLNDRPTIDDYKDSIVSNMSLNELIEFAHKKRIDIRDVTNNIDEEKARKEQKALEKDASLSDEFKKVAQCIRDFKPLKNYHGEYMFQAELTQYLRRDFPNTNIEKQRGSSRPDIDVNGIGIEVKGPTFDEDLNTIPDKLIRYSHRFPKGIIVVLFDVHVNPHRYEELVQGINNTRFQGLANIEIIKK